MAPSLPDSALSSAPGRLLFSQHQDIESRSTSPQPALARAIAQLLGCVSVLVLPKTGLCLQTPYVHLTLFPGSVALNLPRR